MKVAQFKHQETVKNSYGIFELSNLYISFHTSLYSIYQTALLIG